MPQADQGVPRRRNPITRAIGRATMLLWGWRFEGVIPEVPKAVLVVAPHTSNWDFPVGVMAMFAQDLRLNWLGKHTLFDWPLGILMRALGGIPVRRGEGSGTVAEAISSFGGRAQLVLALAPEGTRQAVAGWKQGFSLIAAGAGVPVVPVAFDWGRRLVRLGPAFAMTGEPAADEATLRRWFAGTVARRPERTDLR
ncbi:MAG: 1-acyl-sn-glycerol-3-phosphate acyltransferase [Acidobacteriota bacterium]